MALAWWKRPDVAFTLDYGQLAAEAEVSASKAICKRLHIPHHVITLDCSALGSGDMAGDRPSLYAPATDWWPYRNQLLVTLTAMRALEIGVQRLFLATVKSDGTHRDGTQAFVDSISNLLACQEGEMLVEAPAIHMSTAELIRQSGIPGSCLALAHSCHKANFACGNCRGCNKYFNVYEELGYDLDRLG